VAVQAGITLLSKSAGLGSAAEVPEDSQKLAPGSHLLVFLGGPVTKGGYSLFI
jgi:hypothetical protein